MSEKEFLQYLDDNAPMFEHVYIKHCRNYSRNDLMQEIALELWRSLSNFKNNSTFNTWAYAIARNVCVGAYRKQKNEPITVLFGDYKGELYDNSNSFEVAKQLQDAERYNNMLNAIKQPYRTLFDMYVHGATFKELEKYSGIASSTLRTRICRIKKKLKSLYAR